MTTYKITPMERKASFASLKAKESRGSSFSNAPKAAPTQPQKEQTEDYNPLLRSGATVLDVSVNVLQGATDALEGIFDFGAGIVGFVGGLFSDEFENNVKDFIAYDFTSDVFGRDGAEGKLDWTWGSDLSDASYLEEDGIINSIAQGVGGMLPAVAISAATGGAAAGAFLSKLPTATFMASAAGRSTEDALKEGADFKKALGYGTVAGVIEGGLESLGGITMGGANQLADSVIGRALVKKGADSFVRRGIGKLAYNFASEGVEEILADLIDPINKQVFGIDKDAMSNYGEVLKGLPKTFVVGGATGVVMGGLQSGISAVKNNSKGGKRFLSVAAEMQNIEDVMKASEAIKISETSTDAQKDAVESAANKQIVSSLESISENLKGMSETQRAECLKAAPVLHDFVDSSGDLNADVMDSLSAQIKSGKATTAFVSRSLAGKDKTVQADLEGIAKEAAASYAEEHNVSLEEARAAVGTFAVNDAELSEKGQENFRRFVKARNALDTIAGAKTDFVVTKTNDTFHAAAKDGKLYIGADSFENGTWERDLIHEYTHFEEGTKEYENLAKFLTDKDLLIDTKSGERALVEVAAESVLSKGYGFTAEEMNDIIEKKNAKEPLTAAEAAAYSVFNDELVAHSAEYLLGNEAFIDKLVAKDAPLARKIFDKLVDVCKAIGGKGASKTLKTAQKLYIKAAEKVGNVRLAKYFLSHAPELEDESLDSASEVRYNRKKDLYTATPAFLKEVAYADRSAFVRSLANKTADIAEGEERTVTIYAGSVYVFKADGYMHGTMLRVNDGKASRKERINAINNDREIADIWTEPHRSSGRGRGGNLLGIGDGRGTNENDYVSQRKSARNQPGDSERAGENHRTYTSAEIAELLREVKAVYKISDNTSEVSKKTKFSLKDSTGATLTEAQAEYFKDSRVRDKDGNLLVVYHGSSEDFNVFDITKSRSYDESPDYDLPGFYFSESDMESGGYGDNVKAYYVNVTNPYGGNLYQLKKEKGSFRKAYDYLVSEGYDGFIDTEMGEGFTEIIAFHPEQAKLTTNKTPTKSNDIRFSKKLKDDAEYFVEDKYFQSLMSKWNTLKSGAYVKVGEIGTKNPLHQVGMPTGTLRYDVDKLRKNMADHEDYLTTDLLKLIPDIIADPIAISEYSEENTVSVFGEATVGTASPMMVGVTISKDNAGNDISKVRTYNARKDVGSLITDDTILYLNENKKRTQRWFLVHGIQVPLDGSKFGLIRSIAQKSENVKRKKSTAQLSRKAPRPSGVTYEISDGQVKRLISGLAKGKKYSKADADEAIHEILLNSLYSDDERLMLRGKARKEVVSMILQSLNTEDFTRRDAAARKVADYIVEHAVLEGSLEDINVQISLELIKVLRPYLRKLDLDSIKDEIAHRYDNKTRGVYSRWSKPKDKQGLPIDVVAKELAEQGFVIEEQNPADIFFAIASAYEDALANVATAKQVLKDAVSTAELSKIKQEIVDRIVRTHESGNGTLTAIFKYLDDMQDKFRESAQRWSERFREEHNRTYYGNRVLHKLRKLKDLKTGAFLNASQYKTDTFKDSIEQLTKIEHRGNLNKSSSRKILAGLAEWYKLGDGNLVITEKNYDKGVAATMQILMQGEGEFTADELLALENVVDYFTHFVQNWGKVYRDGKYVEAKPLAEMYRDGIIRNNRAKVGWMRKWFEKYYRSFGDPEALMRYMDAYDPSGFYTTMFLKLRDGLTKAQLMEMEMREDLEAFYEKHKDFLTEIQKKTIEYRGQQIPLAQAMLLYMTFNRDQALRGLAYSGFRYYNGDAVISVEGFAEFASDLSIEALRFRARLEQQAVGEQFTETEKEYISIIEKLFNEDCKQAKRDTDTLLRGYSNALESYYVPIRRGTIAKSVDDASTFYEELDRVSNAGFNKDTVKNAKNELFMEGLDRVIDRHVRAVSMYANLALVLNEYDVLYNLDLNENPNKPVTIGTAGVNTSISKNARQKNENGTNPKDIADEYFEKLIADIQGVSKHDAGDRVLGKLRGSFAKFQLGANPKVWLTQLSSFIAATSILDYASVVKGFGVSGADVDKYCALAKLRNHENTAALAQGVIEKTDKLGDILMAPIGKMDRLVVRKLFAACQVQVEKDGGAKIGTEENKVKAGELLSKVIYETQQNSLATERSAAMRHHNEIIKTLTMFSADAMKIVGRTVDAIGELATLKKKRAQATDQAEIKELDAAIKKALQKTRKSVGALVMTSIFMALIAQGFRFLYDKDDEDTVWTFLADVFGNLFGGLPLIREFVSRFTNGYDLEHYAYATVNDLLSATVEIGKLSGDIIQGKATGKDVGKAAKNMLYAAGTLFGIPTRNAYNFVSGISRRLGADFDGSLYDADSYREQLESAIESGDEDKIAKIVGLMLDEKVGIEDDEVRREMAALVGQGFDGVIPSSVPSTITIDKVKYELDEEQKATYEKIYNTSIEKIATLVRTSAYKSATPEAKAKAMTTLYSIYRELAREAALDLDLETKGALFGTAFADKAESFALAVATASLFEADKDKKGESISGTRKAKVQKYVSSLRLTAVEKYMIMGYLGYSNTNGKAAVRSYINRLDLTPSQKRKLLEFCGYK